jgi:CheY-like chemotaxis protein
VTAPEDRTALVVDADAADRRRVAALLRLTGWDVHEAAGTREALATARRLPPALVVADLAAPAGEGVALLRRLRLAGCRAEFVVVSAGSTAEERAAAAAAGALACLPKPLDAGVLLDFLRGRLGAAAAEPPAGPTEDRTEELDADLRGRLQELYAGALPARLHAIADGARSGDAPALALASATLAGTSAQLGHPEVAAVCRAIARDARRGILAHDLVVELRAVAAR